MSDNTSFGTSGSGSGGGAVTGANGSFVDGAIVTLGTEADTAVTNSASTATTQAFIKGAIKVLADVWDSVNHRFNIAVQNGNPNGSTTSPNAQPVTVATDQLPIGATLTDATSNPTVSELSVFEMLFNGTTWDRRRSDQTGVARVSNYGKNSSAGDTPVIVDSAGRLITIDLIRYALMNGTLYSLGSSATSTGVSSAAIALFGGAGGISKNTLILSVLGSSIGNQDIVKCGTLSALDANVATNTTPTPLKSGGSASLYTGANAAINFPTGTSNPAYTGSFFRFITQNANVSQELGISGLGIYFIPANTANAGFECVLNQGSAAGIYALNLIWVEF